MQHPPIFNANSVPQETMGYLPDMSDTLMEWLRPMVIRRTTKTGPNAATEFKVLETAQTPQNFNGCIQPYPEEKLVMKPTEQRSWKWWKMFSTTDLLLINDDKAEVDNITYRVMSNKNWNQAGFFVYEMIQTYQNGQPA